MVTALKTHPFKACFVFVAILFVVATTTAAASDYHADLHYHKDCVLCQLAQLALIQAPSILNLPPLSVALEEIPLLPFVHFHTLTVRIHFVRGPPL